MKRNSSSSLAPGFRFHPTDEELVWYYLKRKVSGKSMRFDPISEVDVYKSEPWDLPDKSKLKSRDLEWYFFSMLDKKYGNGSKTNRATEKGYWKTTGKDRAVHHGSRDVGMKKTLVYHLGRAPSGKRTNWVMHEYRLTDLDLHKDGVLQDAFVLCRVFQKSGSGPKNGEQYGAPFVEEEWEDNDEVAVFSEQVGLADEMVFNDDIHVKSNSLNQIVDFGPPPRTVNCGETCKSNDNGQVLNGNDEKLLVGTTSMQHEMDVTSAKAESTVKSSDDMDHVDISDLLDGLYWDAPDNLAYGGDIQYLETNDLSNPVETNPGNFDPEDFFTFYDTVENQFLTWSSSQPMGMGSSVNDGAFFIQQPANGGTEFLPISTNNGQLTEPADNGDVSWLKHMPETKEFTNGSSSRQVIRKATSSILGSIPAPPAFAAEFPGKDLVQKKLQLNTSSSSILTGGGNGLLDWSFSKNGAVSVFLSFQAAEDEVSSNIMALPSKFAPWWTQVYSFVSWGLFLSVGFKFGCSIFASACRQ